MRLNRRIPLLPPPRLPAKAANPQPAAVSAPRADSKGLEDYSATVFKFVERMQSWKKNKLKNFREKLRVEKHRQILDLVLATQGTVPLSEIARRMRPPLKQGLYVYAAWAKISKRLGEYEESGDVSWAYGALQGFAAKEIALLDSLSAGQRTCFRADLSEKAQTLLDAMFDPRQRALSQVKLEKRLGFRVNVYWEDLIRDLKSFLKNPEAFQAEKRQNGGFSAQETEEFRKTLSPEEVVVLDRYVFARDRIAINPLAKRLSMNVRLAMFTIGVVQAKLMAFAADRGRYHEDRRQGLYEATEMSRLPTELRGAFVAGQGFSYLELAVLDEVLATDSPKGSSLFAKELSMRLGIRVSRHQIEDAKVKIRSKILQFKYFQAGFSHAGLSALIRAQRAVTSPEPPRCTETSDGAIQAPATASLASGETGLLKGIASLAAAVYPMGSQSEALFERFLRTLSRRQRIVLDALAKDSIDSAIRAAANPKKAARQIQAILSEVQGLLSEWSAHPYAYLKKRGKLLDRWLVAIDDIRLLDNRGRRTIQNRLRPHQVCFLDEALRVEPVSHEDLAKLTRVHLFEVYRRKNEILSAFQNSPAFERLPNSLDELIALQSSLNKPGGSSQA